MLSTDACHIRHYKYNNLHLGSPKTTFQGGEIHSTGINGILTPDRDYRIEARIRSDLYPAGLITSFFLYGYDETNANSDEVDFEFASRQTNDDVQWPPSAGPPPPPPDDDPLLTNTWNESAYDAPVQDPRWYSAAGLSLTDDDWDTFVIYWYPAAHRVDWRWIHPTNGEVSLRTDTDVIFVPDEAMSVYFNFWAPPEGDIWGQPPLPVGSSSLQPDQADAGVSWDYEIDHVRVAAMLTGDADDNGVVDAADYVALKTHMGQSSEATRADGDFEGDGNVDWGDLQLMQARFGQGSLGAATIPEPTTLLLLAVAGIWGCGIRNPGTSISGSKAGR